MFRALFYMVSNHEAGAPLVRSTLAGVVIFLAAVTTGGTLILLPDSVAIGGGYSAFRGGGTLTRREADRESVQQNQFDKRRLDLLERELRAHQQALDMKMCMQAHPKGSDAFLQCVEERKK
jgi:hypothetical protein